MLSSYHNFMCIYKCIIIDIIGPLMFRIPPNKKQRQLLTLTCAHACALNLQAVADLICLALIHWCCTLTRAETQQSQDMVSWIQLKLCRAQKSFTWWALLCQQLRWNLLEHQRPIIPCTFQTKKWFVYLSINSYLSIISLEIEKINNYIWFI